MRPTDQAFDAFLVNNSVHLKITKYIHSRRLLWNEASDRDFTFLQVIHICTTRVVSKQPRVRNMIREELALVKQNGGWKPRREKRIIWPFSRSKWVKFSVLLIKLIFLLIRVDPSPFLFIFIFFIRSESIRVDPTRTSGPSWSGPTFCTCLWRRSFNNFISSLLFFGFNWGQSCLATLVAFLCLKIAQKCLLLLYNLHILASDQKKVLFYEQPMSNFSNK